MWPQTHPLMTIKFYNTATRTKEVFKPVQANKVKLYVCGPTVNDVPHLGHARQQITFDVLRRFLEYCEYQVTYVSNITDIEDKIINKANELGISTEKLTQRNMIAHQEDYQRINVKAPDIRPKATEYISEMIDLIKLLESKGIGYTIPGDGVYYDVTKFDRYGRFSGQKRADLIAGARIDVKSQKRNKEDFVLWKFSKPGEPQWQSPWGSGRPGWHIECSAMSAKLLGLPFDIHGGGQDLIFPHHENEIAQSEAAYGKTLANYWMHNGMVNVDNVKMSKSLGNFKTIRNLLSVYSGDVIRYFVLSGHYRKPIDFSDKTLGTAKQSYMRLKNITQAITDDGQINQAYLDRFKQAMSNDLNTPTALSTIWALVRDKEAKGKYQTLLTMDTVLQLNLLTQDEFSIPQAIQKLVDERSEARKNKDWALADQIRDKLKLQGWQIDDSGETANLKRITL